MLEPHWVSFTWLCVLVSQGKYTLLFLDVGVGVVHGVWTNIVGGKLPGGTDDVLASTAQVSCHSGVDLWAVHMGEVSPMQ